MSHSHWLVLCLGILVLLAVVFGAGWYRYSHDRWMANERKALADAFYSDNRAGMEKVLRECPGLRKELLDGTLIVPGELFQYDMVSAAYYNYKNVVSYLLDLGANPNPGASTTNASPALCIAVVTTHRDIAKNLIAHGARCRGSFSYFITGLTLLHHAVTAQSYDEEIVELLLAHGAATEDKAMNVPPAPRMTFGWQGGRTGSDQEKGAYLDAHWSEGCTALEVAAADGNTPAVQQLLRHGAKANARSDTGTTALLLAVEAKSLPCVKALLAGGADPTMADNLRVTPLSRAQELGADDIASELKKTR